ncbi:phage Gp37/Gp68 family protein [Roseomonas terrae]|uniref:Phage Gp37/Gp68 family protein n=1 Tax=Neoroseomonas terrae TaxID=424799 RepID=A0ABS5EFT8_9PROT|nr:phage Gp37/Gp68 family protein [Neoroseomonas terrae]
MGADTLIEWADHTFNPWIGCTKVSPACDNCYAETLATARLGVQWGPHAERRRTAESTWRRPLAWNRKAQREGRRYRVFCASLADVFDNTVSIAWTVELLDVIRTTQHLDWLLLTKRPQLIRRRFEVALKRLSEGTERGDLIEWLAGWLHGRAPENVWLGTTVENQAEADRRIPHLLSLPAVQRFLSCEPLLGPVDLTALPSHLCNEERPLLRLDALRGQHRCGPLVAADWSRIHWVIAGGESGPKARPSHPDWFRSLRDQCQAAGVPFFFKQWGEYHGARPVYPGEDPTWSKIAAEREFGPGTDPEAVDLDEVGGIEDFMRDFPQLGVMYRDGHFYDGQEWQPHVRAGCWWVERVGKKAAGATLDGREWREVPSG